MGSKLQWNPNPENRDKIFAITKDVNLQNREERASSIEWFVAMVTQLRKAFVPRVKELKPKI
jgi:hypothetical protein